MHLQVYVATFIDTQSVGGTGWNGLPLFHSVLGSVCVCFSYPNFWHVRYEKHNLMTSKHKID